MKRERLQHPIDKRSEGITANTLTLMELRLE